MIRSPMRPIAMPSASAGATGSATWKNRYPWRRTRGTFTITAPAMPPSSEMPPSQIFSMSTNESNSATWAIT